MLLVDLNAPFALELRQVSKSYAHNRVLDGLDLDIPSGQRLSIIGSSGSGKTTLLRVIMTLEALDRGTIKVFGEYLGQRMVNGKLVPDTPDRTRKVRSSIGMVFQQFNLFPHMTALGNVIEAPVHVRGASVEEASAEGMELLAMVGLADKAQSYPRQLSGGQQQRVAIARALAMKPRILLFDEVTSALDPERVGEVLAVVRRLAEQGDITMVIVTHEMGFAREIADRSIFMEHGRIVEDAPPRQLFTDPQQPRTREFLRSVLKP